MFFSIPDRENAQFVRKNEQKPDNIIIGLQINKNGMKMHKSGYL